MLCGKNFGLSINTRRNQKTNYMYISKPFIFTSLPAISFPLDTKGLRVSAALYGESVVEVGKSELMVVVVKGGAPRIRRGTLNTLRLKPGEISFDPDYPENPVSGRKNPD